LGWERWWGVGGGKERGRAECVPEVRTRKRPKRRRMRESIEAPSASPKNIGA
jgi:hypothetical protein